jgi:hypothetical protein
MKTIRQTFYIALAKTKNRGFDDINARITKSSPHLAINERLLKLEIEVPKALFETAQLSAEIKVPEDAINSPVIETEILDNIREVVNQQTGVDLEIRIVEPQEAV